MAGPKHSNATTFQKGKSGNPGGRSPRIGPNGETAAQLARQHTAEAIQTLADVCNNKGAEPRDRIAAAQGLLDRGWGKPTEHVEADIKGSGLPVIQIVRASEAPSQDA